MGEEALEGGARGGRDGLNVVLGARGGIGGAIVRELVDQGRRVRAVTRLGDAGVSETRLPPASYEDWACDLTDTERLRRAVAGAAVVYHCARPPYTRWWNEFEPLNGFSRQRPSSVREILVETNPAAQRLGELSPSRVVTK